MSWNVGLYRATPTKWFSSLRQKLDIITWLGFGLR